MPIIDGSKPHLIFHYYLNERGFVVQLTNGNLGREIQVYFDKWYDKWYVKIIYGKFFKYYIWYKTFIHYYLYIISYTLLVSLSSLLVPHKLLKQLKWDIVSITPCVE